MKRATKLLRVLQDSLRAWVAEARHHRWLRENAKAIAAHNERVETRGVFSDLLRRF